MQKTSSNQRRDTSFSLAHDADQDSKIKSEFALLERKYERLLQKEKRLQVDQANGQGKTKLADKGRSSRLTGVDQADGQE